jgi:antagonist of KipI
MAIAVEKPGILDTVQDLGRYGFTKFGINPNGAMDRTAVRLINILLGNPENAPVIECHFPASEFVIKRQLVFALGGGDFTPELDGAVIENWRPILAKKGSVLRFSKKRFGNRCYVAVVGGFATDQWLNSYSTNLLARTGGLKGRKLIKGDIVACAANDVQKSIPRIRLSESLIPRYSNFPTVRIVAGPESDHLDTKSLAKLVSVNFKLTGESNRMGYRLNGDALSLQQRREYISSAVVFGTIQLLPDGRLIVLMADHQTAGGYPRIASVVDVDLPLLAQLGPNDKLAFHLVSLKDAEMLSAQYEQELNWLKLGVRFSGMPGQKM